MSRSWNTRYRFVTRPRHQEHHQPHHFTSTTPMIHCRRLPHQRAPDERLASRRSPWLSIDDAHATSLACSSSRIVPSTTQLDTAGLGYSNTHRLAAASSVTRSCVLN
jgi:hypothetical protein